MARPMGSHSTLTRIRSQILSNLTSMMRHWGRIQRWCNLKEKDIYI